MALKSSGILQAWVASSIQAETGRTCPDCRQPVAGMAICKQGPSAVGRRHPCACAAARQRAEVARRTQHQRIMPAEAELKKTCAKLMKKLAGLAVRAQGGCHREFKGDQRSTLLCAWLFRAGFFRSKARWRLSRWGLSASVLLLRGTLNPKCRIAGPNADRQSG